MSTTAAPDPEGTLLGAVKRRWRGWLRAIHRDLGYLAVGGSYRPQYIDQATFDAIVTTPTEHP